LLPIFRTIVKHKRDCSDDEKLEYRSLWQRDDARAGTCQHWAYERASSSHWLDSWAGPAADTVDVSRDLAAYTHINTYH